MMWDRTRPMALQKDRPRNYGWFRARPSDSAKTQKKTSYRVRAY